MEFKGNEGWKLMQKAKQKMTKAWLSMEAVKVAR